MGVAGDNADVRDHIPLEQGLRHGTKNFTDAQRKRQRPYSIRTRIKTHNSGASWDLSAPSETIFH